VAASEQTRTDTANDEREAMTTASTTAPAQRSPELLGQTLVVIGGSAGIGLETARRARAEGADVILTGRDPERLARAAVAVDARSTAAFDADDHAALKRFFDGLPGPIDHVLVTAGGFLVFATTTRATCGSRIRAIASEPLPGLQRHLILRAQALREQLKLRAQRLDRARRTDPPVLGDRDLTRLLTHI
jgi:NAD(P)-dependent dehydrogenase (short-subunit alcohol dehydrogenase family)